MTAPAQSPELSGSAQVAIAVGDRVEVSGMDTPRRGTVVEVDSPFAAVWLEFDEPLGEVLDEVLSGAQRVRLVLLDELRRVERQAVPT